MRSCGRSGRQPTSSKRLASPIRASAAFSDAFRGRVIFPIFDPAGKAIGLGGRILPGTGDGHRAEVPATPRRRRSTRSAAPSTGSTGRSRPSCRRARRSSARATPTSSASSAGAARAVATCGTALTEDHFRLLGRFAKRVVLAFDADAAGQSARARFYEWERRHELEVAVAALPPGSDPADLAMQEPELLRQSVREAKTFLSFRVERARSSGAPDR